MNQQDNQEANNESIIIEDLRPQNAEEIKGGADTPVRRGEGADIIVFDIVDYN